MATAVRLYLTGRLLAEGPAGQLHQDQLPGRQGRRAFAHLGLERSRPIPRDALATVLWPDDPPAALDTALSAIMSKLRHGLASAGLDGVLLSAAGCYELRLPPNAWLDVEVAATHLDRAEAARAHDDVDGTWASASVAYAILRRPFLPGDDGDWVNWQRERLHRQHMRASDCLAHAWLRRGRGELAQHVVEEAIAVAPLREENHRLLIRAHLAQGNRSEALLAYHRCRDLLIEQLGVEPAVETEEVYRQALHHGDRP